MSTIRAAFDLGSSNHKIIVARVTPSHPPQVLYSNSTRIPLADALASNPQPNSLPRSILHRSLSQIIHEKRYAESLGATSFCAIATHVFRTSQNGSVHLTSLRTLGIHVVTLSQSDEGELAFLTALSTHPAAHPNAVVWDSGGGSTQWSYMAAGAIHVHPLPIGSAAVRAAYAAFNDRRMTGVTKLVNWVSAHATTLDHNLSTRFTHGVDVLGIGGESSMFAIMAAHHRSVHFAQKHVWEYVAELLAARDEQSEARLLPKMVLLAQLMACYGIRSVKYVHTNGSCLGLLASDSRRFWPEPQSLRTAPFFGEVVQGTSLTPRC